MQEIWKDITDYEGYYQVSNLGNIRSCDRKIYSKNGNPLTPYTIRKSQKIKHNVNKFGYCQVGLHKDGKMKLLLVHRLVATAFIKNPNILPEVNHLDGNKENNTASNLEWCTRKRNRVHAYQIGLQKPLIGSEVPNSKSVLQYDTDGNFIKKFGSLAEAARSVNGNYQGITCVCIGKHKTAYGYIWKYEGE